MPDKTDSPSGHNHGHERSGGRNHRHTHEFQVENLIRNSKRVFWACILTTSFMLAEIVGGVLSGSLALLADAAHMFIDAMSLFLAWLAFKLAKRPADRIRTYGYYRFPILAAFTNGISLVFVVVWIGIEAIQRLHSPHHEVLPIPMLVIAILGLFVNLIVFKIIRGADHRNLNIRGAMLHVLGDMLGSIAVVVAAIVIMVTGWVAIDPLLSFLVALIILRSAWSLIKDIAQVLLEGVPDPIDVDDIAQDLVSKIDVVEDIHHVHVWTLAQGYYLLTLHARIKEDAEPDSVITRIQDRLKFAYGVNHATVQIELHRCSDDVATVPY